MKFRKQSLLIALASTIAVAGFVVTDLGHRTSPGELAQVHGREKKLAGKWDCSKCHGGFGESMGEACLECHEAIHDQVKAATGLHGRLDEQKLERCATCHGEHHGAGFRSVNARSFALAGVADARKFDHELVGHRMGGRHLEIECNQCHEHAEDGVLQKGDQRFGGLSPGCVACHEDPHQGRMALGCAECHDEQDWKQAAFAPHDRVLPLLGGHAGLDCRKCHAQEELHALETMGRKPAAPARTCQECHESPHRADFVAGVGRLTALAPGQSCGHCHLAEQTSFRAPDIAVTRDEHARSGFLLDVPHDQAKCDDCHSPMTGTSGTATSGAATIVKATIGTATFAERFPGRGPDDCSSCHQDVHAGQFNTGGFAGRGCTACHEREHFSPHAFTVATHEHTAFPLTGSHFEAECNSCHFVAKEGAPRLFHGSPARCDGCHADAHGRSFAPFAAELARTEQGTCARCHVTTAFSKIPDPGFDHGHWTGFALRDAHAQARCESCHPPRAKADATGRTFGRVTERFAPAKGCVRCHADPHSGVFDDAVVAANGDADSDAHQPLAVAGRIGCARCHSEVTFKTETRDFDHGAWTGFALDGAHEQAGCAACHVPLDRPDDLGRTTDRALGPACVDCHADPHAGQFRDVEDRIDCARCHGSADFSDLIFDHDLDSRFPLDETHARVACADCHKPVQVREVEIVRYRPLGTECADCHGAPKEPLRRRRGKHE